nr:Wadjet anti-phage system protein JetD domain-containing protein [uncultured Desulfuromonas sp.]
MLSPEQIERYEEALPKEKTTIDLQTLWHIFGQCFPSEVGSGHAREILDGLINHLQKNGYRLPATKKLYDRSAVPHLPHWIKQPAKEKSTSFIPNKHLWAPELVFLGSCLHLQNHDAWLKIDQWLKQTKSKERHRIPLKERSYEIFRDEKILDSLRKTKPFQKKSITLDQLACFVIHEPLPTEIGPDFAAGKPALVIENPTTYWTIATWNKISGHYSCVIYGGGNKISAAWEWLVWKQEDFNYSEIRYFGDIDIAGFEIPLRVKESISAISELPFSLEVELYQLALQLEKGKVLPECKGKKTTKMSLFSDFPDFIASEINKILQSGKRIPQEVVSLHALTEFFGR